MAMVNVEL